MTEPTAKSLSGDRAQSWDELCEDIIAEIAAEPSPVHSPIAAAEAATPYVRVPGDDREFRPAARSRQGRNRGLRGSDNVAERREDGRRRPIIHWYSLEDDDDASVVNAELGEAPTATEIAAAADVEAQTPTDAREIAAAALAEAVSTPELTWDMLTRGIVNDLVNNDGFEPAVGGPGRHMPPRDPEESPTAPQRVLAHLRRAVGKDTEDAAAAEPLTDSAEVSAAPAEPDVDAGVVTDVDAGVDAGVVTDVDAGVDTGGDTDTAEVPVVTGSEAESETATEPESETGQGTESVRATEAVPETESEPGVETVSEPDTASESEPDAEPEPDAQPDAEPERDAESLAIAPTPLPAVRFSNVSKTYKLYKTQQRRFAGVLFGIGEPTVKHANHDLSFEIHKGESVAIFGRNGAGKSTLLKMVTGVVFPSEGTVEINGTVGALLELTAGFENEFTGRENIYLKAAIMGLAAKDVKPLETEIVDFAELEEYIDQPIASYSSGMRARLGFAITALIEPEILVVDEALSVGDAKFNEKCRQKIAELHDRDDLTVLFVTHADGTARQICERGIVLHRGGMIFDGPIDDAIAAYRDSLN